MNSDIKIDGELANKIMNVRIPSVTMDLLDMEKLLREAEQKETTLQVKGY